MKTVIYNLQQKYKYNQDMYLYHTKEAEGYKKYMDELLEAINTLEFKDGQD